MEFTFIKRRFFPGRRAAGFAAVIGFALAVPGCATIMSGTTERIRFESIPSGAEVSINSDKYTTPAEVKLARKNNYEATFEAPGYIPATRQVTRANNLWILGNILIGGVIGILVDYATGAAQDLQPDVVRVTLVEKPRPAVPADSP